MSECPEWPQPAELEGTITNFDGSIEPGLAERLMKEKVLATHTAWDHHGLVWWDGKQFCEEVWVYKAPQEVIKADSLDLLMQQVNEKYGSR
jgi:hypothetical protein